MVLTKNKIRVHLFFSILLICNSCSDQFCKEEFELLSQKWDGIIETKFKHPTKKNTFVLKTLNDEEYYIFPIQGVYNWAETGDYIYKDSNSQFCFLIKNQTKDTLKSRIFSSTCDDCMKNWPCNRTENLKNEEVKYSESLKNNNLTWKKLKTPIIILYLILTLFLLFRIAKKSTLKKN